MTNTEPKPPIESMSMVSGWDCRWASCEELESWQKRWTRANAERDAAVDELAEYRVKVDALRAEVADLKQRNHKLDRELSTGGQVTA